MSKGFFDIFRESFGPKEKTNVDSEGYTTIQLDVGDNEAASLAVYVVMNEGALRERDRIVAAFNEVDANWVTFALKELEKIPRNLPRDE
jgi:hypothetical protein